MGRNTDSTHYSDAVQGEPEWFKFMSVADLYANFQSRISCYSETATPSSEGIKLTETFEVRYDARDRNNRFPEAGNPKDPDNGGGGGRWNFDQPSK